MKPLLPALLSDVAQSVRACPETDPEDMSVDRWEPEDVVHTTTAGADTYELSMAPERLTMDPFVQITVFVYAYAKLCMLQFWYDLLGQYVDHRCWEPLYMDGREADPPSPRGGFSLLLLLMLLLGRA